MHINLRLEYTEGHPAGYTDDLGIIADRNQWVNEQLPGYYCYGISILKGVSIYSEINDWCKSNLSGYWYLKDVLYIAEYEDAMLFNLAWDGTE